MSSDRTSIVRRFLSPLVKSQHILQRLQYARSHTAEATQKHTKRALLVAINYQNLPAQYHLTGPQQEAEELRELLIDKFGYKRDLITLLTDRVEPTSAQFPSKANLLAALDGFYDGQEAGDEYLFHFGGHSFQYDTDDTTEEDHKDEFILPSVDAASNAFRFLHEAHKGNTVPALAHVANTLFEEDIGIVDDTCHITDVIECVVGRVFSVVRQGDVSRRCELYKKVRDGEPTPGDMIKSVMNPNDQPPWFCDGFGLQCCRRKDVKNNVVCLSACKDSEMVYEFGDVGSMTKQLIKLLKDDPRPTLKNLMRSLKCHASHPPNVKGKGRMSPDVKPLST
ncbi:hypothetical protein DXG01_015255, partial [Tephrocybe rancida]